MPIEYFITNKVRCQTCAGTPTIVPDENQSPEDAALQHLVAHKDDVGGPHELTTRFVLDEREVEEQTMKVGGGDEEQLEEAGAED